MKSLPLQLGQGHGEMYKTSAFYEEVLTKLQSIVAVRDQSNACLVFPFAVPY